MSVTTPPASATIKAPGGVVPDLLAVVGPGRQPEVDVGLAARDHGILRLAVHAQRRRRDAQPSGDGRRVALGAMPRLDRLAEPRGRRVIAATDAHRTGAGSTSSAYSSVTTNAPCPRTAKKVTGAMSPVP